MCDDVISLGGKERAGERMDPMAAGGQELLLSQPVLHRPGPTPHNLRLAVVIIKKYYNNGNSNVWIVSAPDEESTASYAHCVSASCNTNRISVERKKNRKSWTADVIGCSLFSNGPIF